MLNDRSCPDFFHECVSLGTTKGRALTQSKVNYEEVLITSRYLLIANCRQLLIAYCSQLFAAMG